MIGLGSNRLSVCRRGGMRVTQAGRGGMEWLAGGRVPSWASPYSAQATAALKAQFPTQWPTIRDYGFAHPEIVGYMNAYAPEDAKIAYSLVEGIGTRWLVGDGTAYIDCGITLSNTSDAYLKFRAYRDGQSMFGARESFGSKMFMFQLVTGNLWRIAYGNTYHDFGTGDSQTHEMSLIGGVAKFDSTSYTFGAQTFTTPRNAMIFAASQSAGVLGNVLCDVTIAKIWNANTLARDMVPYKKNGAMGMIDLLTGTFYGNANSSGTFTELIESPS